MKSLVFSTPRELKRFAKENRASIVCINNVGFNAIYPILTVSNRYANYYDAGISDTRILSAPYTVLIKAVK